MEKILLIVLCSWFMVHSSLAFELPSFYGEEVVVTATRIPQRLSEQPWSAKVFTLEDIKKSGANNVADLLRSTSGIESISQGYSGSLASSRLRGGTFQQTLVLLDGRRINSPTLGSTDLGIISLDSVERVEVVKTPLSAMYGSDAIGGVVNVITKKGAKENKTSLFSEQGSFSLGNYGMESSGENYFVSANSIYSAGHRANSDYKAENYAANFIGGDFSLNLLRHRDEKGAPYYITSPALTYREKNDNNYIDLKYYNRSNELNLRSFLNILENRAEDPAWAVSDCHLARTYGIEANQKIDQLVLGLDLRRDVSDSTKSNKHNINYGAAYIQNEFKFDYASLFAGGRIDLASNFASQFSPRIGWVCYPSIDTVLRLSMSQAYRAPTINDLYWSLESLTYSGYAYNTVGNPALRPEIGRSIDISFERIIGNTSIKGSYYLNRIQDMIRWDSVYTATSSTFQPLNVANAEIDGAELEINYSVGQINTFANYTWQDAQNKTSGKVMDYSPKNKYNVGILFDHPALSLGLTQRFVGERYADLGNTRKLDGYASTDLTITRKMDIYNIIVQAENIFDVAYQEAYGYPNAGRRFTFGIKYNLI